MKMFPEKEFTKLERMIIYLGMNIESLQLINDVRTVEEKEDSFLIVVVSIDGKKEMIVNKLENAKSKIEYYANAYNDDLTLKNNNKIKIVAYQISNKIDMSLLDDCGGNDDKN